MESKLLEVVNTVLRNAGIPPVDELTADMDLKKDLELDSISVAELIASIDVAFDTDINAEGMIEKVGDIQNRLTNK